MDDTTAQASQEIIREEESRMKRKKTIAKPIQHLLEGDFLSREGVVKNLPYLAFLALIAIIYIGNTFYAEKTYKEIEATKAELKELRYQYITVKSTLMYLSKQTEIAGRAGQLGLTATRIPPYKIYYSSGAASETKEE